MQTSRKREVDSSMDSYWITSSDQNTYTVSSSPIETENVSQLVDALLEEFVHSTEEEKAEFKTMLELWLNEMDNEVLHMDKVEKLRDLIYEMF